MNNQSTHFIIFKLLFLVFQVISTPLIAQTPNYIANVQHFTTTDGLSHRAVRCIFQDRDGMTWIGTQNGLNRFDGYSFKHWLDKNHGVDLRDIINIGQDDEGWLWLNTKKTTLFFHPITEIFKTVEERFGNDTSFTFNNRPSLYSYPIDDFGRIYINQKDSNTMYRYHSSEGLTTLKFPMKIPTGNIIVGKNEGELYYMRQTINPNRHYYTTFVPDKVGEKEITYKVKTKEKPFLIDLDEKHLYHLEFLNQSQSQEYLQTLKQTKVKHRVRCSEYDKQGNVWLGTDFGFYKMAIKKNQFNFIQSPIVNNIESSARGLWADDNQLMVCFEPQLGFANYDFATKEWQVIERMDYSRAIFLAKDGSFWIGAGNKVLHWKDKKVQSYTLKRLRNNKKNGFAPWCFSPSRLHDNWLWLGTEPRLYKLNIAKDATDRLIELNSINKVGLTIQNIVPDKENVNWLWLCTNQGLWLFDEKEEKTLKKYDWNKKQDNHLPSDNFYHLYLVPCKVNLFKFLGASPRHGL